VTPRIRPLAEMQIDTHLVRRLLAAQFPQWAALPLKLAGLAGWDSIIYRLGTDLAVRLPRRAVGAAHVEREHRWLPVLAPQLPLPVPSPLGKGVPAEGYPGIGPCAGGSPVRSLRFSPLLTWGTRPSLWPSS
jgi:aminoglycoside phosphotransferase (APT) family kinase protein